MIVFFINRFNDVDHVVPVVYRIAKDTEEHLLVLSLNPSLNIADDFRLNFLRDKYNVHIAYQYEYYTPTFAYKCLALIVCNSYLGGNYRKNISLIFESVRSGSKRQTGFFQGVFHLICGVSRAITGRLVDWNKFIYKVYNKEWAVGMMKCIKPTVLIFDHATQLKLFNVEALLYAAKKLKIPTIDVPHGNALYIRNPPDYKKAFSDLKRNDKDIFVVPHEWYKDDCIRHGLKAEKIRVLGSTRFCVEWVSILHQIIPHEASLWSKGNGKLKVVYMEMGADRLGEFKSIVQKTIQKLCCLDFIHLIVKPQPRNNSLHFEFPQSVEIARDVNSVNLVKWADAVIVLMSSIAIEVLLQRKAFIYPRYFHNEKMIYEEMGACWEMNNYGELENALRTLASNKAYRPYSEESVAEFLKMVVYKGVSNGDVLGDYKDLILGVSAKSRSN